MTARATAWATSHLLSANGDESQCPAHFLLFTQCRTLACVTPGQVYLLKSCNPEQEILTADPEPRDSYSPSDCQLRGPAVSLTRPPLLLSQSFHSYPAQTDPPPLSHPNPSSLVLVPVPHVVRLSFHLCLLCFFSAAHLSSLSVLGDSCIVVLYIKPGDADL